MESSQSHYDDHGLDSSANTQRRAAPKKPVVLVIGARPEERATLLRLYPMWDFRFNAFQGAGEVYSELLMSPEVSMLLFAKRYLEGPEMITFLCQQVPSYYLFDNKGDLARGEWIKKIHILVGA